ncbi:MAG TPA: sulfatase-like hydrolase/transferase [Burkholderiales bacterium]
MRRFRVPHRLRPALYAGVACIVVATLTRIALALHSGEALSAGAIPQVFLRGLWFDLAAVIFAMTPLVLWLALAPARLARSWLYRGLTVVAFAGIAFGLLLLAVAEWLFWDEFGARFNFIAVDYLLYTHEVLGNIWESYPVGRILAGLALAAAAATALVARRLWHDSGAPLGLRAAVWVLIAQTALVGFALTFPDSGQKNFSSQDGANELAGNGVFDFFAAVRRNELSFERYYATLPPEEALATVRAAFPGSKWIEPEKGGIERPVAAAGPARPLNVILVSIESMGAEFLGAYGNAGGLTPNLDALAKQSLWFANAYATGNRTVRGLEALSLSLPPTPGQSIVRRPSNDFLFSLGSVLEDKGYTALFAYGGYGYFDNMNAFFEANDYRSIDRRNIPSRDIEFENIWGVADEHLFAHTLKEIDGEKAARPDRPVFAHIMTTSNHRPYTYPSGRIDIPSGKGRDGAVKYTDYAVGRLIEGARSRDWFKDTLFVITADHGASARGTSRIPVDKYRIPVFFYAPAHLAPRRVDRLMSQIDIAPTILGVLQLDYYTKFLGHDLLHTPPSEDRAFVANYQTLGYLKGDRLLVLQPKRKMEEFIVQGEQLLPSKGVDPALAREGIAFYQVASHVFRTGLYGDEEQVPPAARTAANAARAVVGQARR